MTVWDQTKEGAEVRGAWTNLLATYNQKVPGHVDQLRTLSNRPLGG
jgi:hypothetical protein